MLSSKRLSNVEAAVFYLLKDLKIRISSSEISEELEKHPDNPSMLAISDVLNWFKIDNAACSIDAVELTEVPTPFIAHTNRNNNFVTVHQILNGRLKLSDNNRRNYTIALNEFDTIFTGVIIQAEASEKTSIFKKNFFHIIQPYKVLMSFIALTFIFTGIILVYTDYALNLTLKIALLTIFKTLGLITSILLLIQSIDKNNSLVQNLCKGGAKVNCSAILSSKAAIVFEGLTWSEVGFFYFAGTWLTLLFNSGSTSLMQLLAILNITSLPYTIYSINYQARIAKQWCMFCCAIQLLLWLEFIPFFSILQTPLTISAASITRLLLFMVIPIVFWVLLKPLLLKQQQLGIFKYQLNRFKYNPELFQASLKNQAKYVIPSTDWSIVLGNPNARVTITMVSNPYCQPCSAVHEILDKYLDRLDDIQLRVVFNADNHEKDRKTTIVRHLMALNDKKDQQLIKNALYDWYSQKNKDYKQWAKAYPIEFDESKFDILDKQEEWRNMAKINSTPTLLLNGYRLPDEYHIQDIKYLLSY